MKNSRSRRRNTHQPTPAAICLPPPKPPLAKPRAEPEVVSAMRLPHRDEPLVTDRPGTATEQPSRQMRRRAARTKAKSRAMRSTERPQAQPAIPPQPVEQPDLVPLPRDRALALPRRGITAWFARLMDPARPSAPRQQRPQDRKPAPDSRASQAHRTQNADGLPSTEVLAQQMLALRSELALAQRRLDGLISATQRALRASAAQ